MAYYLKLIKWFDFINIVEYIRTMKLDQLEYFVTTAKTQHIGKSSKILNISPSAISHSIRQLEQELGHKLFNKSGKNIYLTDYGKSFSERAESLLTQSKNLKNEFSADSVTPEGVYRLGATHGLCETVLAPLLASISNKCPKLVIEVSSLRSADVKKKIVCGELDLGILFSPVPHPQMDILLKKELEMKIAVKKNHKLSKLKPTAKQISELPAASPKALSGISICENHPGLENLGISQDIRFTFDSYPVVAEYVKKSNAWVLFPENLIASAGLQPLNVPKLKIVENYSLVVPKGRTIPPLIMKSLQSLF